MEKVKKNPRLQTQSGILVYYVFDGKWNHQIFQRTKTLGDLVVNQTNFLNFQPFLQ